VSLAIGTTVAVMGGSLGGLTAALVLRDAGCDVQVYERSKSPLQDRGAGIVLHPTTIRYLTENGIVVPSEAGVAARWLRYLSPEGEIATQQQCRFRFTSYRALYRELLGCFEADRYHLGSEVAGFTAAQRGVDVHLAGDESARFELLVCADGVRSSARARLQPEVEAQYAGYVGWRGAVKQAALEPQTLAILQQAITYYVMPHSHLLAYPIPAAESDVGVDTQAINWLWYRNVSPGRDLDNVLTDRDGRRRWLSVPPGFVQERQRAELQGTAREALPAPLAELVSKTPDPFVQAVFDVEVQRMAFGRICLIGDAAFALRPHVAAGTAKAADDAWRLGSAMADSEGDVEAALRAWEPGQLALGRSALRRTREAGERSQFRNSWRTGDPLPFGLHEQGDSSLPGGPSP
jgi:2,6-dihydroxypyridine 3-monooxygenase